jgi:hypothetical protein
MVVLASKVRVSAPAHRYRIVGELRGGKTFSGYVKFDRLPELARKYLKPGQEAGVDRRHPEGFMFDAEGYCGSIVRHTDGAVTVEVEF